MTTVAPIEWFGPFLIPAVLFALGAIGYAILAFLSSRDLLPGT